MSPATLQALSLPEITALALLAECGYCWAHHAKPCNCQGGTHVERFARAYRRGLLTSADLSAVLTAAGAFTSGTVLYETGVSS